METNEPLVAAPQKAAPKRHISLIIVGLIVITLLAIGTRLMLQEEASFPSGDQIWAVTQIVRIEAPEPGAVVRISPPWDTRTARLYGQQLLHPGMRHRRIRTEQNSRDLALVATRAGSFALEAHYDIHISRVPRKEKAPAKQKERNRAAWLVPAPGVPVEAPQVAQIIAELTHDKPTTAVLVRRIFDYVSERVVVRSNGSDDGGEAIEQRRANNLGTTRAAIALFRAAHLPARLVTGLELSGWGKKEPIHWAEVFYADSWHPLDVVFGHFEELPPNYIPLRKGSEVTIETEHARLHGVIWKLQPSRPPRGLLVDATPSILDVFDLTRLSARSQETLALMLLLPLGALTTLLLRQLVGIRTFGTFSATLLALAAVFVDWVTGVITFALVTLVGITGRAMMPALKLTRIPRLSIVFTLVAMIMVMVVSLLNYFELAVESEIVLLPIVILTTLVDTIYRVADERGLRIALFRLGWTLFAALIALAILLQNQWGMWILSYPEIHAATIAAIIAVGHYQGKRLSSFKAFSWIREPAASTTKSTEPDGST